MPHGRLQIARIATSTRERLDALRTAGGVVDRAQHEMEAPQDFVGREPREALAQRGDERAAGLIEVVGDELREQRGVFRGQHTPQTRELVLVLGALNLGERGPDERLDDGLELQTGTARVGQQLQTLAVEAWRSGVGKPRRAIRPCRGSGNPRATSSRQPRRQSCGPRRRRIHVRQTAARPQPGAVRASRRRAVRAASIRARGAGWWSRPNHTAGLNGR